MILPDVNLLLYAYNQDDPKHKIAKDWLENAIKNPDPLCLTWHTIMGFLRISTSSRIFPKTLSTQEAFGTCAAIMDSPGSIILNPGRDHFRILTRLVNESGISGAKLMDAHIAAIAVEHRATVASSDRDFLLFNGLKLINPLES